jgi:hypothetical protein
MEDPYDDRSMPWDYANGNDEADDLLADLENMKPPELDYYAVLNLSKTVRRFHWRFFECLSLGSSALNRNRKGCILNYWLFFYL